MSREAEARRLRRRVVAAGCQVRRLGSGHFRVDDPAEKFVTTLGNTPGRGALTTMLALVTKFERAQRRAAAS